MEEHSSLDHDELSEYEIYGKTPPRTKILRKNKDRKHREKYMGSTMSSPKVIKSKNVLSRRNTVSTMYDELFAKADQPDMEHTGYNKRSNKRHMKLLRGSERDLKLDIASAQAVSNAKTNGHNDVPKTPQPSYQVESCKRFMSLSCRTVQCLRPNNKKLDLVCDDKIRAEECPPCRVEFYQTLSLLIRMGGGIDKPTQERHPRRYLSREETLWQNELKDVIWLELQAFHADRTPIEEDIYLCGSREGVDLLLKAIMNYRFESPKSLSEHCEGCLSISCSHCLESQNRALLDIEDLMARLEDAEALFPSSKAFAELYPMYNSPDFVGRVKAIILWYNMTKHNRFKLIFLDRLFNLLQTRQCQWPLLCDDSSDSPSDSNNSNNSSMYDYSINCKCSDLHVNSSMLINKKDDNVVSPYRRYIENLLKTRALHKSLMFLDKLHQFVLQKSQVTLEKPASDEIFSKSACDSDEEELQRYGCWSPEAKALNLPSYRAGFLFLATVPLEVIYEYLQMRLEQKPQNPSPLSVRQLMRELKGGLHIASTERSRILKYFQSAVEGTELKTDKVMEKLEEFDKCMLKVFEDYLDYLEQWALLHHDTFQKNLLEEEFQFSINLVTNLPGGDELLANKFGHILSCILKRIGERLLIRIEDVLVSIPKEDDNGLKQALFSMCRELQALFNEEREMSLKTMSFCKTLFKCAFLSWKCKIVIRDSIISFKCLIPKVIARVQNLFDLIDFRKIDELDKTALNARIREILMQVYRFGFEFYKEVTEGAPLTARPKLVSGMVQFANLWMQFVTERCERGRGMRPRWAYQGLEFLLTVCEPCNTKHLSENEFEELKRNMDICISHVIGTIAPSTPDSGFMSASPRTSLEHIRAKSRGSSPSPRPTYKSQRSNISTNSTNSSRKTSMEQNSPIAENLDESFNGFIKQEKCVVKIKLPPKSHSEQVRDAIEVLESELDQKLRSQNLIGKAMSFSTENKMHFRRRNVTFSWQRGIKIGQGRFGKVYTAVNNNTGEMMAVKEVALQHNDNLSIKRVAEEIKILEGVIDQNLVRSYGVEVHKDEMLIFMEFCAEGTLESLVAATEAGLPELLVRRYTYQLVSGVGVLHDHGIVHRDIKTANIFLTEGGNSLKIGDFGCAAKIKSNSTMPGELKGFVGTQAYMAPEVFTKNMAEGYGRAADIWSVGCVVVEMASGKRPWAEFDSNYQIMFKVGMGQSPDPPDDMIDEGLDFLEMCFKHNPKERATAGELSNHNFVKVGDDLI